MFRRDPLDAVLGDIRSLLGANLTPLYPLLREVYARGGVLGVRHEGQTLLVGLKQIRSDEVFELASVTKPFTAALAGALVQAGRLEWTAPVARLGGPLRRLPASLTALTLATHTAGVPAHPFRTGLTALTHWHDPYAAMSEQAVLNSVKRWASANSVTKAGQPSRFLYSNLGAGALALALASAAGQPPSINGYGAALAQYVTQPLELPSITLTPPERHSTAYSLLGSTQATRFGPLAGAGGLYGTAADLLTLWSSPPQRRSGNPLADDGAAPWPARTDPQRRAGLVSDRWGHLARRCGTGDTHSTGVFSAQRHGDHGAGTRWIGLGQTGCGHGTVTAAAGEHQPLME